MRPSVRRSLALALICISTAAAAQAAPARLSPRARTAGASASGADARLRVYDRLTLDPREAARSARATGRLSLATRFGQFDVRLAPHDMRPAAFRAEVEGAGAKSALARLEAPTFKGTVDGLDGADARFTLSEDGGKVDGLIVGPNESYILEPLAHFEPLAGPTEYVFYRTSDVIPTGAEACGTSLSDSLDKGVGFVADAASKVDDTTYRVVELATEADLEFVNRFGGVTGANNEILGIMNQVEGVYQSQLGITFDIVYQHSWTGSEPYAEVDPLKLLQEFQNYWERNITTPTRDLVHMWTGRTMPGGVVGISYVGVVCADPHDSYGVSQWLSVTSSKYIVAAHEIGHNFNAQHCDGQAGCSNTIMTAYVGSGFTFCPYSINQVTGWSNAHNGCTPQGTGGTGGGGGGGGGSTTLQPPTSLAAQGTEDSVILRWADPNAEESGVKIERKEGAEGAFAQIATVGPRVGSYTDATATLGSAYVYRVRAFDGTGDSAYSNEAAGARSLPPPPAIETPVLVAGIRGVAYSASISVAGGKGPFVWSVSSGALPDGLALTAGGVVAGMPAAEGTFAFTVQVTDSLGRSSSKGYTIVVAPPPPRVVAVAYNTRRKTLVIAGENFGTAPQITVNGVLVSPPRAIVFDTVNGTMSVKGSRKKLGLNKGVGTNTVVVTAAGATSTNFVF